MPNNSEWFKLHGTLPDGGPVYTETNSKNFIAEPWNAVSSLAFLIPAVYWLYKLKNRYLKFGFLSSCIPLLIAGGLGSTLFHAFRTSEYLLMLDYLPIFILTVGISIYLWKKVLMRWLIMVILAVPIIVFRIYLTKFFSPHDAMNIGYFITGILIFLPALLLLFRTGYAGWGYFSISLALFSVSLLFRKLDAFTIPNFPMGTHWLWHIFGAAGSFYLSHYLYIVEQVTAKVKTLQNQPLDII